MTCATLAISYQSQLQVYLLPAPSTGQNCIQNAVETQLMRPTTTFLQFYVFANFWFCYANYLTHVIGNLGSASQSKKLLTLLPINTSECMNWILGPNGFLVPLEFCQMNKFNDIVKLIKNVDLSQCHEFTTRA